MSVYRWRATGTEQAASMQVMLVQCIVGRTDIFIPSFLHSTSLTLTLSHSHNSTVCLATAIPQMWSGLLQAITAEHQVSMTTSPLSHLHLLLALWTHAKYGHLVIFARLSLWIPFFLYIYNFLFPSICTTLYADFFFSRAFSEDLTETPAEQWCTVFD